LKIPFVAAALLLACSCHSRQPQISPGCGGSPPEDSRDYAKWKAVQDSSCKHDATKADALPDWITRLIQDQPDGGKTVIEESLYRGNRTFLVSMEDRCCDSGNEHILRSEDGRTICEFGGFAGQVTTGSCDIEGIKYVRTLYPVSDTK